MTAHQEGIWVRLLKLAAKCGNDCGYGKIGVSEAMGFIPQQIAHMVRIPLQEWLEAAQFFVQNDMITHHENGVITIHKWKHYQGEYLRVREWKRKIERKSERNNGTPPVTTTNKNKNKNKEQEEEKEKTKALAVTAKPVPAISLHDPMFDTWKHFDIQLVKCQRVKIPENKEQTLFLAWVNAAPNVNLTAELAACEAWAEANSVKRSPAGWAKTLTRWFKKEQDKYRPGSNGHRPASSAERSFDNAKKWASR